MQRFVEKSAKITGCPESLISKAHHFFLSGFVAFSVLLVATVAQSRPNPPGFADLAEELLPSVVNIVAIQGDEEREEGGPLLRDDDLEDFLRDFFERHGGRPRGEGHRGNAQGSGFVIDPDGYIVTNFHVVSGADRVFVRMQNGTELSAEVVGSDKKTDLSLLKVEPEEGLEAVTFADSDGARVGDWVIAVGNPFGLGGSVSAGIISAQARDINSGPYDDFIQTDAAINRGNSGGPLFNMKGQVVGVNTAIYSPTGGFVGVGLSIPSNLVSSVIEQLRENGEVRRGWLGVSIQTVTEELAEGLRLEKARGALVAQVNPGGPADKAGVLQGDVILSFDGKQVSKMRRLPLIVAETKIGKSVEVGVWRRGKLETLEVVVGKLEEEVVQNFERGPGTGVVPSIGLTVAEVDGELRERYGIDEQETGLVILGIDPESSASNKSLREGDLILEVDQEPVSSVADIERLIVKARDAGYNVVTLLINRLGQNTWVAVKVED